jgi:hypothetical protein
MGKRTEEPVYTDREKLLINLYKALIEEKDAEIERLRAVIAWNEDLDARKILKYDKDEIVFQSKMPHHK